MKSFSPPAPAMATPPPQQLLLQPCSRDNTCNPNLYSSALPKTFNNLYGRNVFQHDSCAFVGLRCDNPTVAATTQAADVVRHCTATTSTLSSPSLDTSSSSSSSSWELAFHLTGSSFNLTFQLLLWGGRGARGQKLLDDPEPLSRAGSHLSSLLLPLRDRRQPWAQLLLLSHHLSSTKIISYHQSSRLHKTICLKVLIFWSYSTWFGLLRDIFAEQIPCQCSLQGRFKKKFNCNCE